MARIFINHSATADRQVEVHDERSGAVLACGYLQVDVVPDQPGGIAGSLVFVAVDVSPKQPVDPGHEMLKAANS